MSKEFESRLTRQYWLRISWDCSHLKAWLVLDLPTRWLILYWLASQCWLLGFSTGQLQGPQNLCLVSPRASKPRSQGGSCNVLFMNSIASKVTHASGVILQSYMPACFSVRGYQYYEIRILGAHAKEWLPQIKSQNLSPHPPPSHFTVYFNQDPNKVYIITFITFSWYGSF